MDFIKGNRYVHDSEMDNNALLIASYLKNKGWSINSISAILSNMWKESTINSGLWESFVVADSSGYGLVQWTPSTIITTWLTEHNYEIDSWKGQLEKICEEVVDGSQWITTSFSGMSFEEFTKSNESPSFLSEVFIKNYERPLDSNQPDRYEKANYFYTLISGDLPPVGGDDKKFKLKKAFDIRNIKISYCKNEFSLIKDYGNYCLIKNLKTNRKYFVTKSNLRHN